MAMSIDDISDGELESRLQLRDISIEAVYTAIKNRDDPEVKHWIEVLLDDED